jgi:predicted DNA-binding transcriptional regulator AlpA
MHNRHDDEPLTIPLHAGCRRVGITPATALKLSAKGEFPRVVKLGKKRLLPRRAFEAWINDKLGDDPR